MAAPTSGWATLRDCAIVDFLANRPKSEGPISKTDDRLFNKLRASFKDVGLDNSELPPYMNNLDNFHNCIKLFSNDAKGHLKSKVKTSFAASWICRCTTGRRTCQLALSRETSRSGR